MRERLKNPRFWIALPFVLAMIGPAGVASLLLTIICEGALAVSRGCRRGERWLRRWFGPVLDIANRFIDRRTAPEGEG